jgi:pSer/pThr/pTyr-binding forkhead associated (FHA) protein
MFKLVIQDDEGKTTVVPLIRDEITIGRKEGNTIRLTERNVSRRHARILRNNGEVQIEDLGSYNGIRVNNARIAERVALRVSDQVQIGDYKLYLKAEGVEQVDDARTMPIERVVDTSQTPTEAMGAITPTAATTVPSNGTPTLPMSAQAANGATNGAPAPAPAPATSGLASGLASAQMVGSPNRTMVAIADTDPAGRPVATAAAVAALSAPVGYGKLVVLSSNFAGKEFELSRPQMIIGRTDENDIVVNHRSISRNHAKLVREPETGRYTISDLQSSNGVRVNGQDYGKVELRRGDVVDLGHVRLRFVEPGEDFVFARDAVITDVPDVGGKKGLLVAIVLGVLLLGGIGVFFAMKGGGGDKKPDNDIVQPGSGTNGTNDLAGGSGDGSQVAVVTPGSDGSDAVEIGSDNVVNPDAGTAVTTNNNTGAEDLKLECSKYAADREWAKLEDCGSRLATADSGKAKEFRAKAVAETKADVLKRSLEAKVGKSDFRAAKADLDKIPKDSVYRTDAAKAYENAANAAEEDYFSRVRTLAGDKNCKEVAKLQKEAAEKGVGDKARGVRCQTEVAVKANPNPNNNNTTNPGPGSNTTTTVVKPDKPDCDADSLRQKGDDHLSTGMDAAALAAFENSMRCRPDPTLFKKAFLAACRSKNAARAKYYYSKLPSTGNFAQMCIRVGIDPTK